MFSLFSIKMYSVPAYPHKILYKFGDSTEVSIRLKGDEYNKWALTTDNYTLLPSVIIPYIFAVFILFEFIYK